MTLSCCGERLWIGTHYLLEHKAAAPAELVVACPSCNQTYHLGVDAAVVTSEGVAADFASVGGKLHGRCSHRPGFGGCVSVGTNAKCRHGECSEDVATHSSSRRVALLEVSTLSSAPFVAMNASTDRD